MGELLHVGQSLLGSTACLHSPVFRRIIIHHSKFQCPQTYHWGKHVCKQRIKQPRFAFKHHPYFAFNHHQYLQNIKITGITSRWPTLCRCLNPARKTCSQTKKQRARGFLIIKIVTSIAWTSPFNMTNLKSKVSTCIANMFSNKEPEVSYDCAFSPR